MKRISTRMMLSVLMSMMGANAFAQDIEMENSQGMKIYYEYCNDGRELSVCRNKKSSGRSYSGDVVIPEEVIYMNRVRKVTAISYEAFTSCLGVTSVTLPSSMKTIGVEAFATCENLKSITIPEGVTSIGRQAFYNCQSLTAITIPGSVKNIGDEAFKNCQNLSSITLSEGVQGIGGGAFSGCGKLSTVTIPNSVTYIGAYAFAYSGLASVTIGNGVKEIKSTFERCRRLTSVNIPNGVTKIHGAFYGCSNLSSVTIPSSVTVVTSGSFADCEKLTAVHVSDLAAWCKIDFQKSAAQMSSNPLKYAHKLYLNGTEIQDLVIPEGVTDIRRLTFPWCNFNSVTIPKSITNIYEYAFWNTNITNIYCKIANPTKIYGKNSDSKVFSTDTFNNASLFVPAGTMGKYKATDGWKDFIFIEEAK